MRLLIFLLATLIPACASSSPLFRTVCSASNISSSLPRTPFPATPARPLPQPLAACWPTPDSQWRFKYSTRTSSGTVRAPGMSSSYAEQLKGMSLLVKAWKIVVRWRRKWKTTSIFVPWEQHEQYERAKRYDSERWTPSLVGAQYSTRVEWRSSCRKNEESEPKQKWHPVVVVSGSESPML